MGYDSEDKFTWREGDLEVTSTAPAANRVPPDCSWSLSPDGTVMYVYDADGKLIEERPVAKS